MAVYVCFTVYTVFCTIWIEDLDMFKANSPKAQIFQQTNEVKVKNHLAHMC